MQLVCREVSTLSPGSWTVVISGNGQDKIIDLHGPFDSESEALIQWYLEDFADSPFTNYRANAAVAAIENYTTALWGQLQIDTPELFTTADPLIPITLSIIFFQNMSGIDRLHWELLENRS